MYYAKIRHRRCNDDSLWSGNFHANGAARLRIENGLMPSTHRSVAFFADAMLGKLARWLRILGYDTAYERDVSDEELIERVGHEKRWLLTRDRYLAQRRLVRDRLTLLRADRV